MKVYLRLALLLPFLIAVGCSTDEEGNLITSPVTVSTDDDNDAVLIETNDPVVVDTPAPTPEVPNEPPQEVNSEIWDDITSIEAPNPGGPTGGAPDVPGTSDTSAIAGLWDLTLTLDGYLDNYYFKISEDGVLTTINYLGDEYDFSDDCYNYYNWELYSLGEKWYRLEDQGFLVTEFQAEVIDDRLHLLDNYVDFEGSYPLLPDDVELSFTPLCSDFDDDIEVPITPPVDETPIANLNFDTSAIAGLWDLTETFSGETDVFYIEITSDGVLTIFDFLGDSFDQGEACYYTYSASLSNSGNNTYTFYEDGEPLGTAVNMFTVNLADGNIGLMLADQGPYPLLSGLDPNIPICDFSAFASVSDQGKAKRQRADIGRKLNVAAQAHKLFVKR